MLEVYKVFAKPLKNGESSIMHLKMLPVTPSHPEGYDRGAETLGTMSDAWHNRLIEILYGTPSSNRQVPPTGVTFRDRMGQRIALAYACRSGLRILDKFEKFCVNLEFLPDEVILYWFTGCFYGRRTRAFRAALVALLSSQSDDEVAATRTPVEEFQEAEISE